MASHSSFASISNGSTGDTTSSSGGDPTTIILDIGSAKTKVGFRGDEEPRSVFPTITGVPINPEMIGVGCKNHYVGSCVMDQLGALKISRPIVEGTVADMDHIDKVIHHAIYNELRADPSEYTMLMTDKLFSPKQQREDICMLMFENYGIQGYSVYNQCLLAMYGNQALDSITGVVVDCGDGLTEIVPIYEGFVLYNQARKTKLSGNFVTELLKQQIQMKSWIAETSGDFLTLRKMKEKTCYVTMDYEQAKADSTMCSSETFYELPDGSTINLDQECYRSSEPLFRPYLAGLDIAGLPQQIYEAVMKCPIQMRRALFGSVILEGGTSNMEGFRERIQRELEALVPQSVKVNVMQSENKYGAWVGGDVLSSMMAFQDTVLTKEEYEEKGPFEIHRRFYFEDACQF